MAQTWPRHGPDMAQTQPRHGLDNKHSPYMFQTGPRNGPGTTQTCLRHGPDIIRALEPKVAPVVSLGSSLWPQGSFGTSCEAEWEGLKSRDRCEAGTNLEADCHSDSSFC